MKDIWNRLETRVRADMPTVFDSLRPGATHEEILRAEKELGVTLPADVRESYAIRDGQEPDGESLFGHWSLSPLESIVNEWKMWKGLHDSKEFEGRPSDGEPHHSPLWWHPGWIPISSNGGGDSHCVDLAPGPTGTVGQIILMSHESEERRLLASSYRQWLDGIAADLELHHELFSVRPAPAACPTIDEIIAHVGHSVRDPATRTFIKSHILEKRTFEDDAYYVSSKEFGYEMHVERHRITSVTFHPSPGESGVYPGVLPHGLLPTDGHAEVIHRRGAPTRGREPAAGPRPTAGWTAYDEERFTVRFGYQSQGRGIKSITYMAPDAAPGRS